MAKSKERQHTDVKFEEIINELYKGNFVQGYVWKKLKDDFVEDIIQDVFENLCNNKKQITKIYKQQGLNGVRRYVSGMVTRMLIGTGIYNRKYRKHFDTISPISYVYSVNFDSINSNPLEYILEQNRIWQEPKY